MISSTAAQLPEGGKQQLWGEAGREGVSFRLETPKLSSRLPCGIPAPGTATAGALPELARLNSEWWWNTSARKMLITGNSLHFILCVPQQQGETAKV